MPSAKRGPSHRIDRISIVKLLYNGRTSYRWVRRWWEWGRTGHWIPRHNFGLDKGCWKNSLHKAKNQHKNKLNFFGFDHGSRKSFWSRNLFPPAGKCLKGSWTFFFTWRLPARRESHYVVRGRKTVQSKMGVISVQANLCIFWGWFHENYTSLIN